MKKLITITVVMTILLLTNTSYSKNQNNKDNSGNQIKNVEDIIIDSPGAIQNSEISDSIIVGEIDVGGVGNTNVKGISAEATIGNIAATGGSVGDVNQGQGQALSSSNENNVTITDNSSYTEIIPTNLLNPNTYTPLADKVAESELHVSKSIFKIQRNIYTTKELTRFANPGQFLGIFWPEWDNTYDIEIATFARYKSVKTVRVVPSSRIAACLGLVKIGEAQASAKKLNKSEHQVMAALAVKAAEVGATVIVYRGGSSSLVEVKSFVVGGGGARLENSINSIFNGATGIGSSTSEKLTRPFVVAELYR